MPASVVEFLLNLSPAMLRSGQIEWVESWPGAGTAAAVLAAAALLGVLLFWDRLRPGRGRPLPLRPVQRLVLLTLQLASLLLVLGLLWRPVLRFERLEERRNRVSVLIDTSRSMRFGDQDGSRLQRARAMLAAEVLPELESRFPTSLFAFSDRVRSVPSLSELPAPGDGTRLQAALLQILQETRTEPLGAVVLVSDGGDPQQLLTADLDARIRRARVPVHVIGVGRERIPEDLELSAVWLPRRALARSRVQAQVVIRSAASGTARLVVRDGARTLAVRQVELDSERGRQVEWIDFDAGPPGRRDLRFVLEPRPGERILANNERRRVLDVPERRLRVLYLEGEPRWEYKFLRRALEGDSSIELASILRTTDNKLYRQGVRTPEDLEAGFPDLAEQLFEYDAVVIGSVEAAWLTPEQHELLAEFVSRRGGSLLMLGGRSGLADGGWGATRLGSVLPCELPEGLATTIVEEPAVLEPTRRGALSPVTQLAADSEGNRKLWRELPPVAGRQLLGRLKPGAVTLLQAHSPSGVEPFLVWQRYGRGRAAVLATGGTWRWHMQLPPEDTRHRRFWRQLLRFLAVSAPGPIELSVEPVAPAGAEVAPAQANVASEVLDERPGQHFRIRLEVRDAAYVPRDDARAFARVDSTLEPARHVELQPGASPGVFVGEVIASGDLLRIEASAELGRRPLGSATVHVQLDSPANQEAFRPEQQRPLLEQIAERSGGRYWTLDALSELPEAIRTSRAGVTRSEVIELWNVPAALFLLFLLRCSEWWLRRRFGTV